MVVTIPRATKAAIMGAGIIIIIIIITTTSGIIAGTITARPAPTDGLCSRGVAVAVQDALDVCARRAFLRLGEQRLN